MSKTKRRKHTKPLPHWVTHEYVWENNIFMYKPLHGKDLAKAKAKYHADSGVGYGWVSNAPAWFRRDCNRYYRTKMNREVKRIMIQGDYYNYSFEPFKKNAGWLYW